MNYYGQRELYYYDDDINMTELYPDDTFIVVSDDDQPDLPSDIYGPWYGVWVFSGFIVLSFLIVGAIMYISRTQERFKRKTQEFQLSVNQDHLKSSLACRPWTPPAKSTASFDTHPSTDDNNKEQYSDLSDDEFEEVAASPKEHGEAEVVDDAFACAICRKDYLPGEPVYESNNPQCGHQCHQRCMDKWLEIQNSCPICNQAYVLQHDPVQQQVV